MRSFSRGRWSHKASQPMLERPRFSDYRLRHRFGGLVQPRTGLVTVPHAIAPKLREADLHAVSAPLGDLSFVKANIQKGRNRSGIGGDLDPEVAWIRAVVEAAERYACLIYDERDFTVESAAALGDAALDLDRVPVCSQAELADPRCPLRRASNSRPIRWVQGVSLVSGRPLMVPAIMVHLSIVPWEDELFWLQISTGAAAHTDPVAALVFAICECVERDAIALTWLGRLPLRRLQPGADAPVARTVERSRIEFRCFDATTDLGIPTVLSLQGLGSEEDVPISMSCGTALLQAKAAEKARREAGPMRGVLYRPNAYPDDIRDFTEVIHGAAYYADGHRPEAFDFLLAPDREELPPSPPAPALAEAATPDAALAALMAVFRGQDMEVVAVDLTTDELRDAGLWAVRTIIPDLVPLSFAYRARYLGTPRLSRYLEGVTGVPFPASAVNPDPIPFA